MATLLLSAAGAAIGGSFGGSVAGLTSGVLGKAVGATLGAVIDQRLTGLGSEPVETGRVERFRVMGASEGETLPRVYGRARVAGQVIWSSRFLDDVTSRRVGGKGGGQPAQEVREHSYSVSLAVALCEGEVARVGRIWADGQQLDLSGLTWRLHPGSEDQLPDPLMEAIEGRDEAPAYRGTAYVLFENLPLAQFGNRVPQFNFEVLRRPSLSVPGGPRPASLDVRGVALVPGTGEYALATEPVHVSQGKGRTVVANVNNDRGRPDVIVSLEQMRAELPAADAVSLVVSWFGDDLRCDRCSVAPVVEQADADGKQMPWRVSSVGRSAARIVSRIEGRPAFGGTPADASVVQAIRHMTASGKSVMFYPFILMDILAGNRLPDPWTGAPAQPPAPWRGRITLSAAPETAGSPDKTAAARAEVEAFFGSSRVEDFQLVDGGVRYFGPQEWSYRRFILHYAHLCALAGGIDAFCIGSEMRSLTQIRDGADSYPAVRALCDLARDVRAVLGASVKIGYAADWSEYFGHHPNDGSGDVLFHLDPLWAHPDIDFVGIDNYMPLADWRDGSGHVDAGAGAQHNLDYLMGNVAGGEGFDWFYADADARERQARTPISDGLYNEPWVFRYKDIANWWRRPHHNRVAGSRASAQTAWVAQSKPIWFTELGCPAVDKGANQPNVFFDPKSSESFFPYYSSGARDDFSQHRYLQAMFAFWRNDTNNPASNRYSGRMVDMHRAFVWAWDARPWPDFPDRIDTWIDGSNFARGHWMNTRLAMPALADVVGDICSRSGLREMDVSALQGSITGFTITQIESARQSLQPLMLAYAFDSSALEDGLVFFSRGGQSRHTLSLDEVAGSGGEPAFAATRGAASEASGRVVLGYIRGDADYQVGSAEAAPPDISEPDTLQSALAIVLSDVEAQSIAERWLSEANVSGDTIKFSLPPSRMFVTTGDIITFGQDASQPLYRIDKMEDMGRVTVSAVRVEPDLYDLPVKPDLPRRDKAVRSPGPVHVEFLDLPLLNGDEVPHAPHVAVTKTPWAGAVDVYIAANDHGYSLDRRILRPATLGSTLEPLELATPGVWARGSVRVRLDSGVLQSASVDRVLNGANAVAFRFGRKGEWEVAQFATATLVGPDEYILSGLLRGQVGSDGIVPDFWPTGTDFVLLDEAVEQIDLPGSARGLLRHIRVGPATRPYDDPSFLHFQETFNAIGLRPYRPSHLSATIMTSGDIELTWIRRTRIDGDSWEGPDAPLGEDREQYNVRLFSGERMIREFAPRETRQTYLASLRAEDGGIESLEIEVAQVSERFGPGPHAKLFLQLGPSF